MIAQLILSLSILVGLHEIGHLVAAKVFGMRVEQYSIGFPPKLFGVKYGETEYSVGAIPLGGFVKISGMIDESLDTEKLKEEPKEWEFRAKPAWQRLIVMMGGIIINVILGIIIFIFLTYRYGETYITKEEANKYGIYAHELGEELGLQTGDRIVKVNGQDYETFGYAVGPEIMLGSESYYTVDREGQEVEIPIPADFIERLNNEKEKGFISPLEPFEVGKVSKGMGADKAGLMEGDRIVKVNGEEVPYFQYFSKIVRANENNTVDLEVQRSGRTMNMTAEVNEQGQLGFRAQSLLERQQLQYSFTESIPIGTVQAFEVTILNIKGLGKILRGEVGRKSVKSIIGITEYFGGTWDWRRFWYITGMLSMWLAFLNFLPIPALDGGHVMFLTYEIVSGRKPSDKFLETAQKIGMAFLLVLMVFLIGNDIINLF